MTHELSAAARGRAEHILSGFPQCENDAHLLRMLADELDQLSAPAPLPEEIERIRQDFELLNSPERTNAGKAALAIQLGVSDISTLLRALEAKTRECDKMREALTKARDFVELSYDESGGEEAVDAKHVLDLVDAALATKDTTP